jgi:hypothetical protein
MVETYNYFEMLSCFFKYFNVKLEYFFFRKLFQQLELFMIDKKYIKFK